MIEAGVRPTIRFASAPIASTRFVLASIATTDGSEITIPRSRTWTSVLAVPRSMPMSREKRPRSRSSMLTGRSLLRDSTPRGRRGGRDSAAWRVGGDGFEAGLYGSASSRAEEPAERQQCSSGPLAERAQRQTGAPPCSPSRSGPRRPRRTRTARCPRIVAAPSRIQLGHPEADRRRRLEARPAVAAVEEEAIRSGGPEEWPLVGRRQAVLAGMRRPERAVDEPRHPPDDPFRGAIVERDGRGRGLAVRVAAHLVVVLEPDQHELRRPRAGSTSRSGCR